MVALSGSLEAINLPALVRFLAGLGASGSLRAEDGRWAGEIALERGQVVAASFGTERGLPALEALALGLRAGRFAFVEGAVPAERTVAVPQDELDALLDRAAAVPGALSSPAAVPRLAARPDDGPAATKPLALTRGAVQTLLAVDGRRTVADLAAGRGLAATVRHLAILAEAGLVTAGQPEAPPPAAPPTPPELAPAAVAAPSTGAAAPTPAAAPPTPPEPAPAAAGACPWLGFADAPTDHFPLPARLHRCFAGASPQPIGAEHQGEFCLTDRFPTCARFVADAPRRRGYGRSGGVFRGLAALPLSAWLTLALAVGCAAAAAWIGFAVRPG
jgi:hypothetical protein